MPDLTYGPNKDLDGLKDQDLMVNYATSWGTFLHTAKGVAREATPYTGGQGATLGTLSGSGAGTAAAPVSYSIGFVNMNGDPPWTTPAVHTNSGSGTTLSGPLSQGTLYGGVVAYSVDDVVDWSTSWAPLTTGTAPPLTAPEPLFGNDGGFSVFIAGPFNPVTYGPGTLTITGTINGSSLTDSIFITIGTDNPPYPTVTWGPTP